MKHGEKDRVREGGLDRPFKKKKKATIRVHEGSTLFKRLPFLPLSLGSILLELQFFLRVQEFPLSSTSVFAFLSPVASPPHLPLHPFPHLFY